uniref:Uncharacterized protein n=1 Tax=Tanacetum cinerariifolium TaxID=118510 RepID=A0A699IQ87_TANCI|nr:hypothetical protein [Tanacetum cinerariifolium]
MRPRRMGTPTLTIVLQFLSGTPLILHWTVRMDFAEKRTEITNDVWRLKIEHVRSLALIFFTGETANDGNPIDKEEAAMERAGKHGNPGAFPLTFSLPKGGNWLLGRAASLSKERKVFRSIRESWYLSIIVFVAHVAAEPQCRWFDPVGRKSLSSVALSLHLAPPSIFSPRLGRFFRFFNESLHESCNRIKDILSSRSVCLMPSIESIGAISSLGGRAIDSSCPWLVKGMRQGSQSPQQRDRAILPK